MVAPALAQEALLPPSGRQVFLFEVLTDRPAYGLTYRYRFVAPDVGRLLEEEGFEAVEGDMAWLCETYALPRLAQTGPAPSTIIISLGAAETPFGEAVPDVVQLFEAYRPEGDTCVWEPF